MQRFLTGTLGIMTNDNFVMHPYIQTVIVHVQKLGLTNKQLSQTLAPISPAPCTIVPVERRIFGVCTVGSKGALIDRISYAQARRREC